MGNPITSLLDPLQLMPSYWEKLYAFSSNSNQPVGADTLWLTSIDRGSQ
jgi:hypothetical protein